MASEKVTKKTLLGEVVSKHPEAARVMLGYGLHCVGCHIAAFESIEEGAKAHGLSDKQIAEMVKEINTLIAKKKRE